METELNLEFSDVSSLLLLSSQLHGLNIDRLHHTINTYLEGVTGASQCRILPIDKDNLKWKVGSIFREESTLGGVLEFGRLKQEHLVELKEFLNVDIESFVSIPIAGPSADGHPAIGLANGYHATAEEAVDGGGGGDAGAAADAGVADQNPGDKRRKFHETALLVCLVNKKTGEQFTQRDVKIAQECFSVCKGVILNTLAYQEEERLKSQFQKLLTVAKNLFTHLDDVTVLLRQIMSEARKLTQAERCSLFLVDRKHQELVAKVFDGNVLPDGTVEQGPEMRLPIDQGIAGHVVRTGKLVNIPDAYHHPLFYSGVDQNTGFKTKNILCFPICDDSGVIGVAELCNKEKSPHFTRHDEEMATAFSAYCGLAILHSLMYKKVADAQYRSKLSNELMMYHMKVPEEEVQALVSTLIPQTPHIHPEFDKFRFTPRTIPLHDTAWVVLAMFKDLGMIQRWRIPEDTLGRFILMVKRGYRDPPYHNWSHAFSVAHFAFLSLKRMQLMESHMLSELEGLALLIACLCHDVDHRGTNNSFQISSNSVLAALYSSEGSVMERHHFAQSMCILNTEGCNILENLNEQEYTTCLDLLRENILATDIAHHLRILPELKEMARKGYNRNSSNCHRLLSSLVMTASDLSDQTKDWSNSKQIAQLVYTEFFTQGDLEKAMGNKPVESMDREKAFIPQLQIQFLDAIALPVFRVLSELTPEASYPYEAAQRNMETWQRAAAILRNKERPGDVMNIFQDETLENITSEKETA